MTAKEQQIYIRRVQRFTERIADLILMEDRPFTAEYFKSAEPVPYASALKRPYLPIKEGDVWGQAWDSAWFRLTCEFPDAWREKRVSANLDFSGEGLVYGPDGRIIQGISNGSVFKHDFNRDLVRLSGIGPDQANVELQVEAAANGLFGVFTEPDPVCQSPRRYGWYEARVNRCRLCIFDEDLWHLWLDLRILLGLIKSLPETGTRRMNLINRANEVIDAFGENRDHAKKCREILQAELGKPAGTTDLTAWAIGHAHIDTAWLWPVCETVRKCGRTFASQVRLIDRYPGYVFCASQPQQYEFVKEHYPDLYARIKELVAAGRWEPVGAMWVEADCNLTSAESLIRQILLGKNFFKDEFGVDVDNVWLPDAFGFTAGLPQIMVRSGLKYFMSQKLSWNQVNEFPYHTFVWRGLDGSEVLAHFLPENDYNSMLTAESLAAAQNRFKEKAFLDRFLSLFGVGDGGGGPKEENIEFGLRMKSIEGLPRVRFGRAADFFHGLDAKRNELPVWSGDLYLELHRGTFTTQAWIKNANRRIEHDLRALEMLCAAGKLSDYPGRELDEIWKKALLNQFHDILPGSSITRVYDVARVEYKQMQAQCRELSVSAAGRLFDQAQDRIVLFNCLAYPFERPFCIPWQENKVGLRDAADRAVPVQVERNKLMVKVTVPAYSYVTLRRTAEPATAAKAKKGLVLENELVRYEFNRNGNLIAAFDKECGRDILLPDRQGNLLCLYDDHPNDWDAWDIDVFYQKNRLDTAHGVKFEKICDGPVRQTLFMKSLIGRSDLEQFICLASGTKRLDFETMVDWAEKHKMLRVGFWVNVRSGHASIDTATGFIRTSVHAETAVERMRFEVPVHRYADLSDNDYGVALLNDSKYGMRVGDNYLDLNLLRSPTYPDPDADQGRHVFTYSLFPHKHDLTRSGVLAEASQLNQGICVFDGFSVKDGMLPWRVEGDGLCLDAVKKAEKEECLVLRVIETHGRQSRGRLIIENRSARLVETDLMEWAEGDAFDCKEPVQLKLGPFEIRTYKLYG